MGMADNIIKKSGIKLPEKYQWLGSAILGVLTFIALTWFMWLIIIISAWVGVAKADDIKDGWVPMAETFLIVERDARDIGRICRISNEDLNSNLGADITLWKRGAFEWHVRATHHSCAFGPDAPDYNAIGTGIVIRFVR